MFRILEKYLIGPKIQYARVLAPEIAKKARAGQFLIVTHGENSERIPLTLADWDAREGSITMVFQEMGKTTHRLGELKAGDSIENILGPQGQPTEIRNFGRCVVIGGGIGIAPVYPLARALSAAGNRVTAIVGYRSSQHVFWEDRMRAEAETLVLGTNDGSAGRKGMVTDFLKEILEGGGKVDRVFAIGPMPMMRAVAEMTREPGIPSVVSMNTLMVCGMGMCGACRVTVGGKTYFTCMDGPDFDGHAVDFDEALRRLSTYKAEENVCFEEYQRGRGYGCE
jgi:ferredoxin--NADP+ reductase